MAMARIDLPCMAGIAFPSLSAILGAEQVTGLLIFHAPGRGIHPVWILGIDGEVVDYVVVAAAQVGKSRPAMAAVGGREKSSGAGAEKNVIRVLRIVGEAAHVASIRPQRGPLSGPGCAGATQCKRHS